MSSADTIVAIASASGRAGVGVVRISGASVPLIAQQLLGVLPEPRRAVLRRFLGADGDAIDRGLAIYFPAPNSYTGEHCLELHAHGSPVVLDLLVARVCELGARPARPGEFSERAFLNERMDLAQAEAVADLIAAGSVTAARAAARSLEGEFSARIRTLQDGLIHARVYVEAALDFAEEEIDFLSDGQLLARLTALAADIIDLLRRAGQGALLREGARVVLAGAPNVGKSSLINRLCGRDVAIVTPIPGTTRDALRETMDLDGLAVQIVDTAGLRETDDMVEQEGVRRSRSEMERADLVLLMHDHEPVSELQKAEISAVLPADVPRLPVHNKIDVTGDAPGVRVGVAHISARTGEGIEALRAELKRCLNHAPEQEGIFLARRRHLEALQKAERHLQQAVSSLSDARAGEIVAEDLRAAHTALGEILGVCTTDDLLGKIFSEFCIGK